MGKKLISLILALSPLTASSADNVISVGYGEGVVGTSGVAVPVTVRHDGPIHGFSLSLAYPRNAMRLTKIQSEGTALEALGVDFFNDVLDDASGTAILGAIFSLSQPYKAAALPPTAASDRPQVVAWLVFDVLPDAPAGEQRIELLDGLGDPPVNNRFTFQGQTIKPTLKAGTFNVYSDNVLTLESKFAFPGARIGSLFAYARHSVPLQGFQLVLSYNPHALEVTDVTYNGTAMAALLGGPSKIEFYQSNWDPTKPEKLVVSPNESQVTIGVVFDYILPYDVKQVLPPETTSDTRQSLMKFAFNVKDGADALGEFAPLVLADSSDPAVGFLSTEFLLDNIGVTPRKVDGRIYFSTGTLTALALDYVTGAPVANATATLEPGGTQAKSGADGKIAFQTVPAGPVSAVITAAGYLPARASAQVAGKNTTTDLGQLFLFKVPVGKGSFRRGFVNGDGKLDLSDAINLLGMIFMGQSPSTCMEAEDVNDDSRIDISDAITLVNYLFIGGQPPAPPFTACGSDPTPDSIGCASFSSCP